MRGLKTRVLEHTRNSGKTLKEAVRTYGGGGRKKNNFKGKVQPSGHKKATPRVLLFYLSFNRRQKREGGEDKLHAPVDRSRGNGDRLCSKIVRKGSGLVPLIVLATSGEGKQPGVGERDLETPIKKTALDHLGPPHITSAKKKGRVFGLRRG